MQNKRAGELLSRLQRVGNVRDVIQCDQMSWKCALCVGHCMICAVPNCHALINGPSARVKNSVICLLQNGQKMSISSFVNPLNLTQSIGRTTVPNCSRVVTKYERCNSFLLGISNLAFQPKSKT